MLAFTDRSSVFRQEPTSGGFSSTPCQSSPFCSTFQQTQLAFGSSPFVCTTFTASSQSSFAFGSSSTMPAFSVTSIPASGTKSIPALSATGVQTSDSTSTPEFSSASLPTFVSTSTRLFGSTGTGFGVSSTPTFSSTATSPFRGDSNPLVGNPNNPALGAASTPVLGSSTTPLFSCGSTPSFGLSASTFGSIPFGESQSPVGSESSPFGDPQTTISAFGGLGSGQPSFEGQQGSRVVPYSETNETVVDVTHLAGTLESISAMPEYKDKSHEELRWEDYQRNDKGESRLSGQPSSCIAFRALSEPLNSPFFSAATGSLPFGLKCGGQSSGQSLSPDPFLDQRPSPFGQATAFQSTMPAISSNLFTSSEVSTGVLLCSRSIESLSSPFFGLAAGSLPANHLGLKCGGQSSWQSLSSAQFLGQTPAPFGQATAFQFTMPASSSNPFSSSQASSGLPLYSRSSQSLSSQFFGLATGSLPTGLQATALQSTIPAFSSNLFGSQSSGISGSLFGLSSISTNDPMGFGQSTLSLSNPSQQSATVQTSNTFSFTSFGQTEGAQSDGFGGSSSISGLSGSGQLGMTAQCDVVMQPTHVANPLRRLPALPQLSIGYGGSIPPAQYGTISLPVSEDPVSVRTSSSLTCRSLSQERIRLMTRKYPGTDGQRVPYFSDSETTTAPSEADTFSIPRENHRSLIICPVEKSKEILAHRNGSLEIDHAKEQYSAKEHDNAHSSSSPLKTFMKVNRYHQDNHYDDKENDPSYINISGHRAGEASPSYEHGAVIPKLCQTDYYTEPQIEELAAKEQAEPGFCCRVKNFVVGRRGFGSIIFFGETDVRRLNLDSIVQFNDREVIVYTDEDEKPPVGQGLNKPAEVTLLNVKCKNKKTGQQYTEGPGVEKYKVMLIKKGEEQGAEFVSFDAVKGEWKFRVKHFSSYEFGDGG